MKLSTVLSYSTVGAALVLAAACSKSKGPSADNLESSPSGTAGKGSGSNTVETPASGEAMIDSTQLKTVYFDLDSSSLTPESQDHLREVAKALKANAGAKVQVEGHCDERGSNEYNLALGERRAQSVQDFLVTEGVTPNRLSTISYGEERPVDPSHTESAWAKNRRAEFKAL